MIKRNEFEIIEKFFSTQKKSRPDVSLGIGDDAALTQVPEHHQLAITTDTLIAGVHFPENALPYDIGYKSLAVNLSDLSAMGAKPAWVTLALTLPNANEKWLTEFSRGFFSLANQFDTQLIGGDLTCGFLSITITAFGFVPTNTALRRDGAKANDLIYVTNTLGEAAFAHTFKKPSKKLMRPEPQIIIGDKLRGIANAAIDISDGLAADLSHILEKSSVGAILFVDSIPLSPRLTTLPQDEAIRLALSFGDDYELCFTVPEKNKSLLEKALQSFSYTCIGKITESKGLTLQFKQGKKYVLETQGYQHF